MGPHLFSFGSIGPACFLLGPSGDLAPAYFLFRPPWPHVFLVGSFGGTLGPHMFCFGTLGPTCFLLGCFCRPWACIFCVLAFWAPVSRFHRRCRGTRARTPWATTFVGSPYTIPLFFSMWRSVGIFCGLSPLCPSAVCGQLPCSSCIFPRRVFFGVPCLPACSYAKCLLHLMSTSLPQGLQ